MGGVTFGILAGLFAAIVILTEDINRIRMQIISDEKERKSENERSDV